MADPSTGAARFAEALFGGGGVEDKARIKQQMLYDQQDSGRAELDRKITQAMLERDKRTAQQSYPGAFQRQLGVDQQGGLDLSSFAIGGLVDNIGQAQQFDQRRRAEAALAAQEGISPANAILAALEGKPIQNVGIDSGHIIANRYDVAPTIDTTSLEDAKIAATNALAGERSAHAGLYGTQAAAGGFKPSAAKPGITRTDSDGTATYNVPGSKAIEQAKAVISDLIAGGGDPMGYTPASVARDFKDGEARLIAKREPNTVRMITGDGVRDIPLGGTPAPAVDPQKAAVLLQARDAIAKGKDRMAVMKRLAELGHGDLAEQL